MYRNITHNKKKIANILHNQNLDQTLIISTLILIVASLIFKLMLHLLLKETTDHDERLTIIFYTYCHKSSFNVVYPWSPSLDKITNSIKTSHVPSINI